MGDAYGIVILESWLAGGGVISATALNSHQRSNPMSNNKGLQFLDKRIIGAIIVDAWQNQLNTEMDPASGQWFTNGPDNNGGLYGHLTDKLATKLVFLPNERMFTSHKIAAATSTADNRNGKLPETTFRLAYNRQQTTTTTHSTTNALMASVSVAFE